ncbi:MAG: tRNA-dihydrouridine synthase, partial [Candidatus Nomurabacteria bacterium]|nr:tRNA-dihydrouridine synthase [Candidatus Nomurabacteria bacterium]
KLAVELIQAAKSGGCPISVKTRLGARKLDEWRPWLTTLLEQNLANLTVHLRTRKEMSKVSAHYELIPEIVRLRDEIAPQTKLTINGDIRDRAQGLELAKKYDGINGIMIGRGIFANPFAFETNPREHDKSELIELLKFHLDQFDKFRVISSKLPADDYQNLRKFDPLKRFFKIYIRDFDGAKELREQMMQAKTTDEVREVLDLY